MVVLALVIGAPGAYAGPEASPARKGAAHVQREAVPVENGTAVEMPPAAVVAASAADTGCDVFGAPPGQIANSFRNVFRGNVYTFQYVETLLEIQMEMAVFETIDLCFSVHRRPSGLSTVPFERAIPDITVRVAGDGMRRFYSSGPLAQQLELTRGFDYMIGVSWGASDVVFIEGPEGNNPGVDVEAAFVGRPCPLDDQVIPNQVDGRAHSMKLCLAPAPGACCHPVSGCRVVLESNCTATGGFFEGERSTCRSVVCEFGACCEPCGECRDDVTSRFCASLAGSWAGADVTCPAGAAELCTPTTGACCLSGVCDILCERDCLALQGEYLGDGSTCEPNLCVGACCTNGLGCNLPDASFCGCFDLTQNFCDPQSLPGAVFKGRGTTCASLTPALECGGACCVDLPGSPGVCRQVSSRSECNENKPLVSNAVYLGDGTSCTGFNVCDMVPRGSCCMADGTCVIASENYCGANSFTLGGDCSTATCTACCVPPNLAAGEVSSQCQMTRDAAACTNLPTDPVTPGAGGTVRLGATSCLPNECDRTFGFCCTSIGAPGMVCEDLEAQGGATPATCAQLGGQFFDDMTITDCAACDALGLGACCRPNGMCDNAVTLSECTLSGGTFTVGVECTDMTVVCPQRGACCPPDGNCVEVFETQCTTSINGTFLGEGVSCDPLSCPTGACCSDMGCEILSEAGCTATDVGGTYQGNDTTCFAGQCPLTVTMSSPSDCAIDAGQPFEPDGSNPAGWDSLAITFDVPVSAVTRAHYAVSVRGLGTADPPNIMAAGSSGNVVTIDLDRPISPGQWTCVTFVPTGDITCLGAIPGDVNGDGIRDAADVASLLSCLSANRTAPGMCVLRMEQCDVDRSGVCGPADLLRVIDLLGGAGAYAGALDSIGVACPGTTP